MVVLHEANNLQRNNLRTTHRVGIELGDDSSVKWILWNRNHDPRLRIFTTRHQ